MIRRTAAAGAWVAGGVLTMGLLSGCWPGSASPSSAAPTTAAPSSTAAAAAPETTAETTAPAVVARPSAAPIPLPTRESVATDSPAPRTTDVVLSFAGWNGKTAAVEAGGYLSPVVESGGTCTLALTKGTRTVTAVSPALADASTTSCGNLSVPGAKLTPGGWTAVLRYASRTTTGTSDPMTVTVPQ